MYAQWVGLAPDVTEAFILIIRLMDAGFLEWQAKEQERKAGG